MSMQQKVKYQINKLETRTRKSDEKQVTMVEAVNEETNQMVRFLDLELPSMRLGDELEVTIKNTE